MTQDEYLRLHWPTGVPEDCTRRTDDNPEDCYTLGLAADSCESCKTYDRLIAQYHQGENQNGL